MSGRVAGIKGFIETTFIDWPGRVAAVLFLAGCNFRCPFCHNPDLVLRPGSVADIPYGSISASLKRHEGWVEGVVVTGGEPTLSPGLEGLLSLLKDMGQRVRLDTNGSMPAVLGRLMDRGLIDSVAMDIKAPLDETSYPRAAGVSVDLPAIRKSIVLLAGSGLEVTFRATVLPALHDAAAIGRMSAAAQGLPLMLQNFRPGDVLDPAFCGMKPFGPDEFERLKKAAAGLVKEAV